MAEKKPKKTATHHRNIKTLARSLATRLADSPLPEIAFISTFILIRWWNNSDFSYPSEVWVPIISFSVLAGIIHLIYRKLLGSGLGAHVASLILLFGLYSYSFVLDSKAGDFANAVLPDRWQTALSASLVLALAMGVACGALGWLANWALRRSKTLQGLQPYKVLLFAILFVFGFQLYKTADRLWDLRHELAYDLPPVNAAVPEDAPASRPDIYYLVFDRYASAEVLKNNFNYDNTELMDFLKSQDFVVRNPAYSNYPFTMSSVTSTLSMDYHSNFETLFGGNGDWQGAFAYREIFNNPPIAQILRQSGYQYNQISSWWDFTRVGIKADTNPTQSFRLSAVGGEWYLTDLQRDIINKSILDPWLKEGISIGSTPVLKYDLTRNPRENLESQISALKSISARSDKSIPQFSFAHVLAPHPPYEFLPDGSDPSYDPEANDNGVDEKVKYTNSLTYLNKRIKELVAHIRQTSPDAVIVIQADEGPYPKQFRGAMSPSHYYDPKDLSEGDMKQKLGILAAYAMPGADKAEVEQINGSVNVFKYILNKYRGYKYTMEPDCHFSTGTKFNIYSYSQLPASLTGQEPSPECAKYDPKS